MTVSYSKEVSTSTGIGIFLKLLLRWKGSIYKIVWPDLVLYLMIYYALNLLYVYGLNEPTGKEKFIQVVTYFSKYGSAIPLSFVLGFYVNVVYNRWWSQFMTIPDPDSLAIQVGANIHGNDEKSKIIRRTIIRYICAAFTITLTMISPKVKKRFPTYQHLVEAGLLNKDEKLLMEELDKTSQTYRKFWLPIAWAANVASRARTEDIIKEDLALKDIIENIDKFREKCKQLIYYDWVSVPLVYTQVVTLAVYLYFLFTVIGTQLIEEEKEGDLLFFKFPFMSCVEFFFYMGWLKVAESLINPFGDDDDDFDVNWMIDRHLQVGYLIVDKIHRQHPKLSKDHHWDQPTATQMPYTLATKKYMFDEPVESTYGITVKKSEQDMVQRDDSVINGPRKRGGIPYLRQFFSRRNSDPGIKLKRISVQDKLTENTDNEWDERNFYEDESKVAVLPQRYKEGS
ncbi:bestrophin-2-like [Sitophilus oryzae]|uniref:Bestrophin homolog n=1 Tax=Sitophilus oryzae TaxID=7048 RepID=A0A6J2X3R1_SITOR|nr:bestrophin-2-like [Sitophilus oryzae]